MLYLVATPIGNLGDFSIRSCQLLQEVDYILCENTKHSRILLQHYTIAKPLQSYHRFNEAKWEGKVISDLQNGKKIALISDAGTPGISDPGSRLIRRCQKENIPYSALPGPCSPILALTLSGFDSTFFQCIGFLPRSSSSLRSILAKALCYEGTTLCFDSPNRMPKTLQLIEQIAPNRKLAIARELTKLHEEIRVGSAKELQHVPFLGEMVLVISGAPAVDFSFLPPQEHVLELQNSYGLSKKEAIKLAAKLRGVPKKNVYF